jgi:hypothetical protein
MVASSYKVFEISVLLTEVESMNSYSLDLLFLAPQSPDVESQSGPPISHVYVKYLTGHDYRTKAGKGHSLITPRCLSFGEFSAEIDRLQKELEDIRESAKTQHGKYEEERQAYLRSRNG